LIVVDELLMVVDELLIVDQHIEILAVQSFQQFLFEMLMLLMLLI